MKHFIFSILFFSMWNLAEANNVSLSNIQIINNGPDSTYVQFDLTWENSWRVNNGPGNYDGVWVFFKYRQPGYNYWFHMGLHPNPTSDFLPAGLAFWRDSSNLGAMFYRSNSNIGTGTVTFTGIRLTIFPFLPFNVDLKGFATEMVFIPTFEHPLVTLPIILGDGNTVTESTNAFHTSQLDNLVAFSYSPISVDPNSFDDSSIESPENFTIGGLGANGIITTLGDTNAYYPTGTSLWCMKYEITQGAYRDFLNTLLLSQQTGRTSYSPTSPVGTGALAISGTSRNYIEIKTPSIDGQPAVYGCDANGNNIFDEPDDGEYVACGFLGWPDMAAWLSWAGMCPMTEIQYERICRGPFYNYSYSPGEYAWGDTTLISTALTISSPYEEDELVSNASNAVGNAVYLDGGTTGPLRSGIFATATSNRVTSGASFFGVMDLSGNVIETCVTVGNVTGRSFNKSAENGWYGSSRGQGNLDINGNAQVIRWPGCSTSNNVEADEDCTVTNSNGTILRGGSFEFFDYYMRVSDRSAGQAFVIRAPWGGGRGVIVPAMYNNP